MSKAEATSAERTITLTLTEREAAALYIVTQNIGGLPEGTRGVFNKYGDDGCLDKQLGALKLNTKLVPEEVTGSIYFGPTCW